MQAIVVSRPVPEQQRRRQCLAGGMAALEKDLQLVRVADLAAQQLVPSVGKGCQARIEALAQGLDRLGQGVDEVLVLAAAKPVASHEDAAAECLLLVIQGREGSAFFLGYERADDGCAEFVEFFADPGPVDACYARRDLGGKVGQRRVWLAHGGVPCEANGKMPLA